MQVGYQYACRDCAIKQRMAQRHPLDNQQTVSRRLNPAVLTSFNVTESFLSTTVYATSSLYEALANGIALSKNDLHKQLPLHHELGCRHRRSIFFGDNIYAV